MNKTNKCTEFQFHWYYDSICFGQSFCPSSGVISRTLLFMQLWWPLLPGIVWNCCWWFYSQEICYNSRTYDRKK